MFLCMGCEVAEVGASVFVLKVLVINSALEGALPTTAVSLVNQKQ